MSPETNIPQDGFVPDARTGTIPKQATRWGDSPTAPKPVEIRGGMIPTPVGHAANHVWEADPNDPSSGVEVKHTTPEVQQ